jgi:hypothetical protein
MIKLSLSDSKFTYKGNNTYWYKVDDEHDPLINSIVRYIAKDGTSIDWVYNNNLDKIDCDIYYKAVGYHSMTISYYNLMNEVFVISVNKINVFPISKKFRGWISSPKFHGFSEIKRILHSKRNDVLKKSGNAAISTLIKFVKENSNNE